MRRKEKEVTDPEAIQSIIRDCTICRLGLSLHDNPYIVPLSFGYDGTSLYFHTAKKGKKIEYINANNKVCFELEQGVHIVSDESNPCKWTFSFQSVIGYGKIYELKDKRNKIDGLNHIMEHYSKKKWVFDEKILTKVRLWKISVDNMTAKQSIENAS